MKMLVCYEEIRKEKKMHLSLQTSVLHFFKSSSGTRASSPILLGIGGDDSDDPPAFQEEVPPP